MKWVEQSRTYHTCSNRDCQAKISIGDKYLSDVYRCFCYICGLKWENNELIYSKKQKRYIDVKDNTQCNLCEKFAPNRREGKSYCDVHMLEVMQPEDNE